MEVNEVNPAVLPIYHLANDEYTNELDEVVVIDGSEGLTFNGNLFVNYALNPKSGLEFNTGFPSVAHDRW